MHATTGRERLPPRIGAAVRTDGCRMVDMGIRTHGTSHTTSDQRTREENRQTSGVSRRAICRVLISVVVDDVAVLVDFQHGFECGVGDDVHVGSKSFSEMKFYTQVALLHQMEAGTIALVGGQVETEEGVAVSVVVASLTVPLLLPDLAGRGEQARVASDEEVFYEVGLEGLGGYLTSVHVHRMEAYGVVLGVKRIFIVQSVVGVGVDAAQYETFRQGTVEEVLVRVRQSSCRNGVHLAVDGS